MAVHLIVPNFEARKRLPEVPKLHQIAMVEWTGGFTFTPFYSSSEMCQIGICQVFIRQGNHPFAQAFRSTWCWAVSVWEFDGEKPEGKPTWEDILDPDCTKEDALARAEEIKYDYEHTEECEPLAQSIRSEVPHISLPPRKPKLDHEKTPSHEYEAAWKLFEILKEQRAARFQVLKTVYPRTSELVEQYEKTTNAEVRARQQLETVEAYFAENAAGWPEHIFKAWQQLNPISFGWMKWLYVMGNRRAKRPKRVNPIDYELAFNWTFNKYHSLTAEELAEAVFRATGERLSAGAIKTRRDRLNLNTTRPTGPRPNSEQ